MGGCGDGFAHLLKLCLEFLHDGEIGYDRLSFEHVVIVVFCPDNTDFAGIGGLEFLCE